LLDSLAQVFNALLQSILFGIGRQAFDQVGQNPAEFLLLAVFAAVDLALEPESSRWKMQ